MYVIKILHPKWDEDVLVWNADFRLDTLKLCVQRRALDIAKAEGLGIGAAFSAPMGTNEVRKKYGYPQRFDVQKHDSV